MVSDAPKSCPICQKTSVDKYRPFCSARCADVDLGRWLSESYAMPSEEAPEIDDNEGSDSHS